jgi:hypothetical protein
VGLALSARTRVTQTDKTRNLVYNEIHEFDAHLRVPLSAPQGLLCTTGRLPVYVTQRRPMAALTYTVHRPPTPHFEARPAQGDVQSSLHSPTGGHALSGDE